VTETDWVCAERKKKKKKTHACRLKTAFVVDSVTSEGNSQRSKLLWHDQLYRNSSISVGISNASST